jgi:transcriptional regulator with XRE-family HTH domain
MTRGEKLRKLRKDVDRTLEDVGKTVGITKQNLYKYENDIITNIPSDKIEALASYYNVTPAYLMGWDLERTSEGYTIKSEGDEVKITLDKTVKELSLEDLKKVLDFARYIESQNK